MALNLLSSSPNWLTAVHALPMYLGLDLRGGVHFLLQVDMQAAITKRLDAYAGDIRTLLRDKNLRHAGIAREGQTLRIRFRDAATRDKASAAIADQLPVLDARRGATTARTSCWSRRSSPTRSRTSRTSRSSRTS